MVYVALMAALLASSAPSDTAQPAEQPAKAAAKDPNKKICRRVVPTGSIMSERSCRSQREWDEITASSQEMMNTTRRHSESTMGQPD